MQGSEAQGVVEAEQGQMRGVRPEKHKVRDTRQPPHTEGVRQDSYFLKSRPTDADNGVPGKPEETSKLGRLDGQQACVAGKADTCEGGDSRERAAQAWSLTTD